MGWQDLGDNDLGLRKLLSQILDTHLNASGSRFDARFGREEHIVVSNHEQNGSWLNPFNTTMIESPKYVLRFVATDADIDSSQIRKVLLPRITPLNRDAVAD
jgi:hypothetical protein